MVLSFSRVELMFSATLMTNLAMCWIDSLSLVYVFMRFSGSHCHTDSTSIWHLCKHYVVYSVCFSQIHAWQYWCVQKVYVCHSVCMYAYICVCLRSIKLYRKLMPLLQTLKYLVALWAKFTSLKSLVIIINMLNWVHNSVFLNYDIPIAG